MASQMKNKKRPRAVFIRLGILVFSVYALITLLQLHGQLVRSSAQLASLKSQQSELTAYNQQLSTLLTGNENQLIMKAIRDKTDYVFPNEKVFSDSAK